MVKKQIWFFRQDISSLEGINLERDNFEQGLVGLYKIRAMTKPKIVNKSKVLRLAEQTQFLTEKMHNFYREITDFLREEIDARQLINAVNWKRAAPVRLNDAESYFYTFTEVMSVNLYYHGGTY